MFDKVWEFLIDKNHKLSKKFIFTIGGIFMLLGVDYFFRFSDSYIAEKKIEQIAKIQEILEKDSLNNNTKLELLRIQKQVINRQNFWEELSQIAVFINNTIISPKAKIRRPKSDVESKQHLNDNIKKRERSVFWHVVSSCWYILFFMVLIPFVPFSNNSNSFENPIAFIIFCELLCIILGAFISYLFALIPVFDNPLYNYGLNLLLPPVFFLIVGAFNAVRNKK